MPEIIPPLYVTRVAVEGLFAKYSYDLTPSAKGDSLSRLMILYGANGSGKTTILWLINHLLNRDTGEGHRTFLAKSNFATLSVWLSDGTVLTASRPQPAKGGFTLTMIKGSTNISFDYVVDKDDAIRMGDEAAHDDFRRMLPDLQLTVLADDRKVSTGTTKTKRMLHEGRFLTFVEPEAEDRSALEPALEAMREWARSRALEDSNSGQRDVNAIYIDLIKRLAKATERDESLSELLQKLSSQGKRSQILSRFALSSAIDVDSIITAISGSPPARQKAMIQVLKPYTDSNEARFAALDALQRVLSTFVDQLNTKFLRDKQIHFDVSNGVTITAGGHPLDPNLLSSGEKQLLVLFCNVVQTSNRQSIFMIDEPELSLNVGWQRQLINALQELAPDNVQFILATHSLELLSRHRKNVAKLTPSQVASALPAMRSNGAAE